MAHVDGTTDDDNISFDDGVTDQADDIHALSGNDIVHGWGGDDIIEGENEIDFLFGDGGDDFLFGFYAGNRDICEPDHLDGGIGNDTLIGGNGGDILIGGLDSDTAVYSDSACAVSVNLAVGAGWWGTAEGDVLFSIENVSGSNFNDVLVGDTEQNVLFGDTGNDTLNGGAGADTLNGSAGWDTASYTGSSVGVTVVLFGGLTNYGDAEGDTLMSIENLTGSNHADVLGGTFDVNVLTGMNGGDTLKGFGGADTLEGGDGSDTLHGGAGADHLDGWTGSDTAAYDESPAGVSVVLLTGVAHHGDAEGDTFFSIENLTGSDHADSLTGDNFVNVLRGRDGNDTLKGYGGADTLWGGDDPDYLYGMNDPDTLHGEAGSDYLDGGVGADTMSGGTEDDIYIVDNPGDAVSESGGQGMDEVRASTTWTLTPGADVETLRTTNDNGTGSIMLTGNLSANHIIGNNSANVLDGGGGTDELEGRGGNDQYIVDSASDTITEAGGQGSDTVYARASYTLNAGADVEGLQTVDSNGMTAINLTGNETGNLVRGNAGNNILNGGAGNDELTGLGGQDAFLFNTALNAATNVDAITDFNVADDTIRLDDAIFSSNLGLGNISSGEFVIGAAALDANDRIIYNSNTGALFYDSDGNGAGAAIQFAELSSGLALTNLDFLVV